MRTRLVIAALALPVALLSACGDDNGGDATDSAPSSDAPSESESESGTPTEDPSESATEAEDPAADWLMCADVWEDGARLARGYQGCVDGETAVAADSTGCSFGRPLVTYADQFYAVPSGIIHQTAGPLEDDRGYRSAMASCRA